MASASVFNMAIVSLENEQERLKALHDLQILGSARLPEYDAVVETCADLFDCPIALISLVDAEEQWFKASCGLAAEGTPREVSFCQYALGHDDLFIVPDASVDDRFRDNPLVAGDPGVRFYAGCPLSIDGVHKLGTLCIIDMKPRDPKTLPLLQLTRMGRVVEGLIKAHQDQVSKMEALRRAEHEHRLAQRESDLLAEVTAVSGVGGWELCMSSNELTWTDKTREIHEVPDDYVPTVDLALAFYPPDSRSEVASQIEQALEKKAGWDLEVPFTTAKGRDIWVRAVGRPVLENGDVTRLIGAFQDITDRKTSDHLVRHSEAVHRTTLEALSEGILVLSRCSRIQSANPAALDMFADTDTDIVGKLVQDLSARITLTSADGKADQDALALAAADPPSACGLTARLLTPHGYFQKWLRINARPIDQEGEFGFDGVVVSLADITETKQQAETLQVIFDNFPGGVAHYDAGYRLVSYNSQFGTLVNIPDDQLEQKKLMLDYLRYSAARGDFGKGDAEKIARQQYQRNTKGEPFSYERHTSDGKDVEIRSTPVPTGGAIFSFFDVSTRKTMERELAKSERIARDRMSELEGVLANMRQGVSVFDRDGRLCLWNQQYLDIFDKPEDEVCVGISLIELMEAEKARGEFDGDVKEHVRDLVLRLSAGEVVRSKFSHPSGKIICVIHAPLPEGGWIGTHEDITLREQAAARITHAAHHDDLTGIANRALFNATLKEALTAAQLQGAGGHVLLMDMDRFKPVNDTYGHDVGDELLRQIAKRLQECVRATDLVARIGGDEFAIILRGTERETPAAEDVAQRVVTSISTPFNTFGHRIQIGVSVGVARIHQDEPDTDPILKKADIALYEVKRGGRNNYRFYGQGHPPRIVMGETG